MDSDAKLPRVVGPTEEHLDPYEAKYMSSNGEVVFRTKLRARWQVPAFTGAVSLFVILWCALHAQIGMGILLGVGTLLTGLFFSVLRVTVSTKCVDIHYGMLGPKIPLSAIESAEPVVHEHVGFLRWGITPLGKGEWLHTVAGDEGRAVKIVWKTPDGKRRVHYIGCHDHEQLAAAIREAKALSTDRTRALEGRPDSLGAAKTR